MRGVLAILAATSLVLMAWADDPVPVPKGPPPRFLTVGNVQADKGQFTCYYVEEIRRVGVTYERREMYVFPANARITSAGGQPIATIDLWKRLKPGQTVLLAADDRKVDPAYLAIVHKDTVVITILPAPAWPRKHPRDWHLRMRR
jgi:hypothetical protein